MGRGVGVGNSSAAAVVAPQGVGPGPGPWALAHWAHGPLPIGPWALAHGPLPIGPMGPCPLGPWALAHWGLQGTKNTDFSKNIGMALPGVENVGAPRESILNLSRGPRLQYINNQNFDRIIKNVALNQVG